MSDLGRGMENPLTNILVPTTLPKNQNITNDGHLVIRYLPNANYAPGITLGLSRGATQFRRTGSEMSNKENETS